MNSAKPRTGRRPGGKDSRGAILKAAQRLFAERGYDATSVRAVAARARVDPALVLHFFGSKAELFAGSLQLPLDPAEVEALLQGDRATLGRRLAEFYLNRVFRERRHDLQPSPVVTDPQTGTVGEIVQETFVVIPTEIMDDQRRPVGQMLDGVAVIRSPSGHAGIIRSPCSNCRG